MCTRAIGLDLYNQATTGQVSPTLKGGQGGNDMKPCVVCYTLDEKMGQTYVHEEQANTLAQRDYKQPQAVIYEVDGDDSRPPNTQME